jgi:hypothetical protein
MDQATAIMADERDGPRALVTDREREILLGEADVTEKYYHVVVTRVRKRINRLADELDALESHATLAEELRDVVCSDESH